MILAGIVWSVTFLRVQAALFQRAAYWRPPRPLEGRGAGSRPARCPRSRSLAPCPAGWPGECRSIWVCPRRKDMVMTISFASVRSKITTACVIHRYMGRTRTKAGTKATLTKRKTASLANSSNVQLAAV
eukprot:scaffold138804_cov32-Prasinocladus_malaysianus.AAC.1